MTESAAVIAPITIRYDGLDASHHEIEIAAFAKSVKGLGRIISVSANFAATQQYVQHADAMQVRVMVKPPKPNCVTVQAVIQWVNQSQLASNIVGGLVVLLVSYVIARASRQHTEMKLLKESLETAIKELGNRDSAVIGRLLDTVDKMADSLRSSAKEAVAPIGRTAQTVTVGGVPSVKDVVIGTAERDAIEATDPTDILPEQIYEVVFTEMNLDRSTARLHLASDEEARFAAEITDPAIAVPNNAYANAFAAKNPLKVKAKATVRDGIIDKLHISDTSE